MSAFYARSALMLLPRFHHWFGERRSMIVRWERMLPVYYSQLDRLLQCWTQLDKLLQGWKTRDRQIAIREGRIDRLQLRANKLDRLKVLVREMWKQNP